MHFLLISCKSKRLNVISPPRPFRGEGVGGEGWSSELQTSGTVFCYTF